MFICATPVFVCMRACIGLQYANTVTTAQSRIDQPFSFLFLLFSLSLFPAFILYILTDCGKMAHSPVGWQINWMDWVVGSIVLWYSTSTITPDFVPSIP